MNVSRHHFSLRSRSGSVLALSIGLRLSIVGSFGVLMEGQRPLRSELENSLELKGRGGGSTL